MEHDINTSSSSGLRDDHFHRHSTSGGSPKWAKDESYPPPPPYGAMLLPPNHVHYYQRNSPPSWSRSDEVQ